MAIVPCSGLTVVRLSCGSTTAGGFLGFVPGLYMDASPSVGACHRQRSNLRLVRIHRLLRTFHVHANGRYWTNQHHESVGIPLRAARGSVGPIVFNLKKDDGALFS